MDRLEKLVRPVVLVGQIAGFMPNRVIGWYYTPPAGSLSLGYHRGVGPAHVCCTLRIICLRHGMAYPFLEVTPQQARSMHKLGECHLVPCLGVPFFSLSFLIFPLVL